MRTRIKLFVALLPFSIVLGLLLYYTATKVRATIRSQFALQVEFIQRTESERLADYLKQYDRTCRYVAELDATTQFVAWSRQRPTAKDSIALWRQQLRAIVSGLPRPEGDNPSDIREIAVLGIDGRPLLRLGTNGGELPPASSPIEPFLESMGIASMSAESSYRSPVILTVAKADTARETASSGSGLPENKPAEAPVPIDLIEDDSGTQSSDARADTDRIMYFGHPVIFENKVCAVVLLGVSLENLLSPVPSRMEVFGGRMSILTSDPSQSGEYLAHYERERVLNRQKDLNRTAEFLDLRSDAEKILQPGTSFQKYLSGKNSRILLTAVPIGRTSWVLMTLIDTRQMLALFEKTLQSSMYLVLAALLGMTLVAVVFMSRWTQGPSMPAAAVPLPQTTAPREVSASELGFPDPEMPIIESSPDFAEKAIVLDVGSEPDDKNRTDAPEFQPEPLRSVPTDEKGPG